MNGLTTLLFDVDGTLADTEEIHRQSFNQAFKDNGLSWEWSPEMYSELLGVTGGKERIRHFLGTYQPNFEVQGDLDAFIAGLHADKTEIYTTTVSSGKVPLRPGVRRLIAEAREAGLRLGIATTTTPANVTALLQSSLATDALDWFEVIAAGSVVPAKKPAADIYIYAMQAMGVNPDECLAFEDSENGLMSSVDAGIKTLVTVSQYTADHNFGGALLVLNHLGEADQPFTVFAGDVQDQSYISVDVLRGLHSQTEKAP